MVTLTNVGSTYDAIAGSKGLGFAEIDFTGVASVTLTVCCNKIGTGTISWQLWNETNGAQIGVIDDAAAAGDNKWLQATFSGLALTGTKRVRLRCKSTVSTDDPVFYGSNLKLVRP